MRRLAILLPLMLCLAFTARAADREVRVLAASSLTNALQDVGKTFEASGAKVKFVFAASSLLARQIEAGAQADVFISADAEWMNYLADRNLIQTGSRKDILSNRLALVAPKDSAVKLEIRERFPLTEALGGGRLALADPDTVPAGRYARSALTSLGVWESVAEKLVRAENVRVALTYVARSEAPLGIVYETDAIAEPAVRIVGLFPATSHLPITYPAALTVQGTSADAKAFLKFLNGESAVAAFKKYGFIVLP